MHRFDDNADDFTILAAITTGLGRPVPPWAPDPPRANGCADFAPRR
jgi:hypothetical protein